MENTIISFNKSNKPKRLSINIMVIGLLLFTLSFSTLHTFFSTNLIKIIFFNVSVLIILLAIYIYNKSIIITTVDILWLLFLIYFIMNTLINSQINRFTLIDVLIFAISIAFLILSKTKVKYYKSSLKLIKYLGIVYALGVIFQYYFTDYYLNYILSLFSLEDQNKIAKAMLNNVYSGITNQTAHTAGYLVSGISVILFYNINRAKKTKVRSFILISLVISALLLTSRRSHLIFMIISFLVVWFFSIAKKRVVKNLMNMVMIIVFITFIFAGLIFGMDGGIKETAFSGIVEDIEFTINGIIEGEDISSGRSVLYRRSLELFEDNPIIGIGWAEFRNSHSLGLIRTDIPSHPHNIYIQLLTELGLIGFILFIIPLVYMYIKTFIELRKVLDKTENNHVFKRSTLQLTLFNQTFFILYGMTENALTDHNFLVMYFFSITLSLSVILDKSKYDNKKSFQ